MKVTKKKQQWQRKNSYQNCVPLNVVKKVRSCPIIHMGSYVLLSLFWYECGTNENREKMKVVKMIDKSTFLGMIEQ